jgi:outer membrane murein-binding lipoprotein Lpp
MKRTIVLGAVAAFAVAVAGCGGGGSKTLSADEYSKELNQICADYNTKVKEIGEPNDVAGLVDKGPQLVDEFNSAIGKAEKLNAPDELKSTADEFIGKSKELSTTLDGLVHAAKANDAAKMGELGAQADTLNSATKALGTKLNAPDCAS